MKWKYSKKMGKRAAALLLALSMFGGMLPAGMESVEAAGTDDTIRGPIWHENLSVTWDTVYFGNYWQNDTNGDGKADKNDEKEPIRWRVLSVENGEALLLSEQVLMAGLHFIEKPNLSHIYNNPDLEWEQLSDWEQCIQLDYFNWENSDMRSRLNGYDSTANRNGYDYTNDSFLNDAFSSAEQEAIPVANLSNNYWDCVEYDPEDPSNTHDKVFLPSLGDLRNPDYGFWNAGDSQEYRYGKCAWPTEYAVDMEYDRTGAQWEDGHRNGIGWWNRSTNQGTASNYGEYGMGGGSEMYPATERQLGWGVRPAVYLKLSETALWSYAGTVTVTLDGEVTGVKPTSPEITKKPPVSMDEAKYDVIAALAAMKMTNSTTLDEILMSAEESVVWGAEIEAVGDFIRTPATETETGHAEITLRITFADGTSDTVTVTWGIDPLNGFSQAEMKEHFDKAINAMHNLIWEYPVSNNTTREEMAAAFKSVLVDEWCLRIEIDHFRMLLSDYFTSGGIYGGVRMYNGKYYCGYGYGFGKSLPVLESETKEKLNEDIDAIVAAVNAMKGTNKTTEKDITNVVNAAIKNGSKVEYVSGSFILKREATYKDKGRIEIEYTITYGDASRTFGLVVDIPKVSPGNQEEEKEDKKEENKKEEDKKEEDKKEEDKKEDTSAPKAGTLLKKGQHTYKVLKKGFTVAFAGTKSTAKSITVPATINYDGITYKVTEVSSNALKNNKKVTTVKLGSNITTIGASAFKGCKKLKTITISSKKLKTVGKKAFSGIYAKAKVKVPSSKKKAYKKLLKGKGLGKKAKIV